MIPIEKSRKIREKLKKSRQIKNILLLMILTKSISSIIWQDIRNHAKREMQSKLQKCKRVTSKSFFLWERQFRSINFYCPVDFQCQKNLQNSPKQFSLDCLETNQRVWKNLPKYETFYYHVPCQKLSATHLAWWWW